MGCGDQVVTMGVGHQFVVMIVHLEFHIVGVAFMRTASTGFEVYVRSSYLTNSNSYGNPYTLSLLMTINWGS